MASKDLPLEIQERVRFYQQVEQKTRSLRLKIETLDRQTAEIKSALNELEKLDPEDLVYKVSGRIMFKEKVLKVQEELTDRKELWDLQKANAEREEEQGIKKLKELQEELTQKLGTRIG